MRSSMQVVTRTRFSQTIGDECPRPGMEARQTTFFPDVPSQVMGRFVSLLVPSPRGPRHAGQFSASTTAVKAKAGHMNIALVLRFRRSTCAFATRPCPTPGAIEALGDEMRVEWTAEPIGCLFIWSGGLLCSMSVILRDEAKRDYLPDGRRLDFPADDN